MSQVGLATALGETGLQNVCHIFLGRAIHDDATIHLQVVHFVDSHIHQYHDGSREIMEVGIQHALG